MACAHEGSANVATKIINASIKAKANAIQFQIWDHKNMVTPDHTDFKLLKRLQLKKEDWKYLINYTRQKSNLEIIACISEDFGIKIVKENNLKIFKIHASDLDNFDLLKKISKIATKIDLSVGGRSMIEIKNAINFIKNINPFVKIWLMYGLQLFPTKLTSINLNELLRLQKEFGLDVGYQDHSDPNSIFSCSINYLVRGMGIYIHEKHISLNRFLNGVDSEAALNPSEFIDFVKYMREIDQSLRKKNNNAINKSKNEYRNYAIKSIVANKNILKGKCISRADLSFLRTRIKGTKPSLAKLYIGKIAKKIFKSIKFWMRHL